MGMRMDQFVGLSPAGRDYLEVYGVKPTICPTCKRVMPIEHPIVASFTGMFDDEYYLHSYQLTDGGTAEEFLQCSPWSSGPVFFTALRLSDGTELTWSLEEMEEHL